MLLSLYDSWFTGMDYQGMNTSPARGGGFAHTTSSQPSERVRRAYDQQTVIPVTIGMIAAATPTTDDTGTASTQLLDGRPLHQVRLVAAVRKLADMSTNIVYEVEDGTGLVEVKQWIDDNVCTALIAMRQECAQEHVYLKIIGQVKEYNGKKMVVADSIRRLKTGNELAHHFLEVVYSAQKYLRQQSSFGASGNMYHPGLASAGVPLTSSNAFSMGDGLRDQLINVLRREGELSDVGASVQQCWRSLGSKYSEGDVRREMNTLASEGILYSTIDENHFKLAM
jgi:replication factor A2